MSAPIHWPSTIAYTVDASLAFPDGAIDRAFASWQSVLPYGFHRVALDGQFTVAPLTDVLHAFHLDWTPIAVNVTVIDNTSRTGMASYVGLDLERVLTAGWEPWVVVLHEIGHAFGLVDRPWSTGTESLYGYAAPHPTGLTADAIDFVQSGIGVSGRDDRIVVTGSVGGRIRGGHGRDTVDGSAGDDVIYGNQGDDVLLAGAGNNTVFGGQDDDLIVGGNGDDVLYGNLGPDTLSGGPGLDRLYGGQGNDVIHAGDGDDALYGNVGNDTLSAGQGSSRLYGGQGDDVLYAGDGDDVLYGNLGNDTLSGGLGFDRLYGGQGDDVVHAGAGDTVWGGVGADTIWAHPLAIIGQHDPADTIHYLST